MFASLGREYQRVGCGCCRAERTAGWPMCQFIVPLGREYQRVGKGVVICPCCVPLGREYQRVGCGCCQT